MTFYNSSGTRLTKTTLLALTEEVTADTVRKFTEDVYQSFTQDGGGFEGASRLAFVSGETATDSEIDGLFLTATATSITPATGPAAGGTPVTITGTNLSGTAGVTFDGVAATNFKVVNNTTITCTTPANTAGTSDVVIQDDAGNVTKSAFFTFT